MGLNAGEFPRSPRDPTVLSDTERRELRRRKVDLGGDGRLDLLDERFLGYFAVHPRLRAARTLPPDGTGRRARRRALAFLAAGGRTVPGDLPGRGRAGARRRPARRLDAAATHRVAHDARPRGRGGRRRTRVVRRVL
jgi:hypothetical protein